MRSLKFCIKISKNFKIVGSKFKFKITMLFLSLVNLLNLSKLIFLRIILFDLLKNLSIKVFFSL